jgi:hypothetical protein
MPGVGRPWFECPRLRQALSAWLPREDRLGGLLPPRLQLATPAPDGPGLWQIRQLRQRIGADPRPFSPLPKRPRSHTRYHRIVDEIRALERGLVGYLGSINQTLQQCIRVRKLKGEW